jgi:hypothetical protein
MNSTQFNATDTARAPNVADVGGPPVGAYMADAGYGSTDNATWDVGLLIAPLLASQGSIPA